MVKFEVGNKVQNIFMKHEGVVTDINAVLGQVKVRFEGMGESINHRWFDKNEIRKVNK